MFLVLNAKRYAFMNEEGGQVEGTTLQYLEPGELVAEDNRRGVEVMTISAPLDFYDQLTQVPGLYDLGFRQRPGKNGRPTLTVTSARFLAPAEMGSEVGRV